MTDTPAPTSGVGAPTAPDAKPFWQSKTVIGSAVAILCTVAAFLKHPIDPDTQMAIVDVIVAAGGVLGGALAIIGRLTASKDLT